MTKSFPIDIETPLIPPLKIQGIKTKLINFISSNISWDGKGVFYEPFMGSGSVGFNLAPDRAVFCDINPYLIQFYQAIQSGEVTKDSTRLFLTENALKLSATPADKNSYYYTVRDRFNAHHDPHDFLFLQRSNFNGLMRFNSKGEYNVPFGRNPNKFSPSLVDTISSQVGALENLFAGHPDWVFVHRDFQEVFSQASRGDFVYLDPPYIGLNDGYFQPWGKKNANTLARLARKSPADYALSMWYKDKDGNVNDYLKLWQGSDVKYFDHTYRVGPKKENRGSVVEALVLS